jgi:hypothetical protein
MSKLILIASAAAMAFSMPALAQGQGKGKGASARTQQGATMKRSDKSMGQVRTDVRARTDMRSNARARTRTGASVDRSMDRNGNGIPDYREGRLADLNNNGIVDSRERRMVDLNGNGIADYRERWIDRDRDGIDDRAQGQYGGAACPPGLAKKTPACMPPGQANRMFREGQRLPAGYDSYTDYNSIPEMYRSRVPYMDSNRYIYRDDRVYIVDPATRAVTRIIDLLR